MVIDHAAGDFKRRVKPAFSLSHLKSRDHQDGDGKLPKFCATHQKLLSVNRLHPILSPNPTSLSTETGDNRSCSKQGLLAGLQQQDCLPDRGTGIPGYPPTIHESE